MNKEINQLLHYALQHHLCGEEDIIYCRNQILDVLHVHDYEETPMPIEEKHLVDILEPLINYALQQGIIEDTQENKDSLDTRIMNAMMPRPSEIIKTFQILSQESSELATNYYYQLSCDSNYARIDRIAKDQKWLCKTKYGNLDITINLSKPEKDPKDIAKAKTLAPANYPKCLLCKENEGYAGFGSHPARNNHRIIPIQLKDANYYLQYSPYSYYPQHCIVFHEDHKPMIINKKTFTSLLAFVQQFPHYFIGSNADLPIVGGSILTHDHFQGGKFTFAMAKAKTLETKTSKKYPSISLGRVYWPMSVIRLCGSNAEDLANYASDILHHWKNYNNESLDILSHSDDMEHHTITPIARKRNGLFEIDLALRNNRTSAQYPDGIFHPHPHLHHIKKENIGLIEVMGLAVLPSRLKKEIGIIEESLLNNVALPEQCSTHQVWFDHLKNTYANQTAVELHKSIEEEIGHIFEEVLEDCGVFKQDAKGQAGFLELLQEIEEIS